jgi:hypothetical protein
LKIFIKVTKHIANKKAPAQINAQVLDFQAPQSGLEPETL